MRTLVLIPTYNEIETLRHTIEHLVATLPSVEVLIIDDNSPDGTGHLADQLAAEIETVSVLHRKKKEGLGRAYCEGFELGLKHNYQWLVEMDADGSHRPEDLSKLLQHVEGHELVIGSRWIDGGEVSNWSKLRQLISRFGNRYASLMLGSAVKDMTSGFRVYSSDSLAKLQLKRMQAHGYAFQVEMTHQVEKLGGRVLEVPIRFIEREGGRSKMTLAIVIEAFLLCTKWGLARLRP